MNKKTYDQALIIRNEILLNVHGNDQIKIQIALHDGIFILLQVCDIGNMIEMSDTGYRFCDPIFSLTLVHNMIYECTAHRCR